MEGRGGKGARGRERYKRGGHGGARNKGGWGGTAGARVQPNKEEGTVVQQDNGWQVLERPNPGEDGRRRGRGGGRGARQLIAGEISGRGDAGMEPTKKKLQLFPVGIAKLEELLTKEDRVVVLTVQDTNFGFKERLKVGRHTPQMLATIINVLVKASGCIRCPKNVMELLNTTLCSDTLTVDVPRYLATAPHDPKEKERLRTIAENLVLLFDKLLQGFPNKASETLGTALVTLRDVTTRFENEGKPIGASVAEKIKELDELRVQNLAKYDSVTRIQLTREEVESAQAPPDDFRSMSIFPTAADVHEVLHPFLRGNVISGSYNDVGHYLDVHFRLMREDFIAPLRDGLTKYLALVKLGRAKEIKPKDIKIYSEVRVVIAECSPNEGVLYRLSFDVSKLRNIRWENSRRLMYGSLICMSSDNFQNFMLGIVINRNPKLLSQGYVTVRLVGVQHLLNINPNSVYLMVESPAYFEAYSPILRGLQLMDEASLPFPQYLINASTNIGVPRYLRGDSIYEFRSLMQPCRSHPCRVLDDDTWPTAEEMGLDQNQFAALKLCITRELAVVQGPPGTGKTFLGLKVVELLLQNKTHWEDGNSPILIVCYTNHALDQFLEGIHRFENNIVRIGSRSKCALLEVCNLSFLRKIASHDRGLPAYVYHNRKELYEQLRQLRYEISREMALLQVAEVQILNERMLNPFMKREHCEQLQQDGAFQGGDRRKCTQNSAIIIWLGLNAAVIEGESPAVEEQPEDADNGESDEEDALAEEEMDKRFQDRHFEEEEEEGDIEIDAVLDFEDDFTARTAIQDLLFRARTPERKADIEHYLMRRDPDFYRRCERFMFHRNQYVQGLNKEGEWEVVGNAKKLKRTVNYQMKSTNVMTEEDEDRVRSVWALSPNDRWCLYRRWISKLRQRQIVSVQHKQEQYETTYQRLKEVLRELDIGILRKAEVIGMTTTGAAKSREMLQIISPKIVVVEEAAEVLESHIITALTGRCEHLIMIGDQQQLRPNPTVYRLAKDYNLDISLFERLIRNRLPYERLELQHRMRPRIAELLVPHIYKTLQNHPSVNEYGPVLGTVPNVFFLSHHEVESSVTDTSSRANEFEAKFVVALCRHFLLQGYSSDQITILSMYLGQVFLIKRLIKCTIGKDVRCTVVDNFQGEENDIILLSLVRSNAEGNVGFLKVDNRVCVALSRAKIGLFCMGNFDCLSENANIWKPIVDSMKRDKLIGRRLELKCENHPNFITEVGSCDDFNLVPEGGCGVPCEYRLACGHQCPKVCHLYDREHAKIECKKPCERILCDLQHKCSRLCFQDCGKCWIIVDKVHPICRHVIGVACYQEPLTVLCSKPCEKLLGCGHRCKQTCGDVCRDVNCRVSVEKKSICGHLVSVACSQSRTETALLDACKRPCVEQLPCGHSCFGNCRACHQGRMHIRCKEKCGRPLVCGHPCKVPCAQNCPPCNRPCENRCFHTKCPLKCGLPCKPCIEPCAWRCEHLQCTKLCHEPCDRDHCNEPCSEELPCGHPCIGFCGEPCPKQCRVCDREEVCEILFGTEDEEDVRFVLLEDCGHIIESSAMDNFIKQDSLAASATEHAVIEMKRCPKCSTIIRKTLRYSTIVNQILEDVVTIKRKIFGNIQAITSQLQATKRQSGMILSMYPEYENTKLGKCAVKFAKELKECHGLTETTNVANLMTFLNDLAQQWERSHYETVRALGGLARGRSHYETVRPLGGLAKAKFIELQDLLLELDRNSSEKQIHDFSRECHRCRLLSNLQKDVNRNSLNERAKVCYDTIVLHLTVLSPFTDLLEDEVQRKLQELKMLQTGLGISEVEKTEILKAMGLGQGHWFKCPNGHFYAIGECGGAMQQGKCNECGAGIGGGSHRLLADNALATEMDAATRPAWPTMLQRY